MATNLEKLRAAYKVWGDSKGADMKPFLALIDDSFVMRSVAPAPPGLDFAGVKTGAANLVASFKSMLDHWTMNFYRAETLVGDGDQVAMFGRCSFTFKATGKGVETPIANLWTFKNGKAVECIEIFDSAKAAMAASPG